jgi:hypothetical protein
MSALRRNSSGRMNRRCWRKVEVPAEAQPLLGMYLSVGRRSY